MTASTYGPFVKYSYKLNSAVESGRIHPLSTDEFVHFTYQEDSVTKTDKYESGDCIKSSFNLDSGIYTNKTIGSSDSIEIVKENSSKIEDSIYAYWQVNNSYNQLFTDSDISGESPNYTFTHVLDSGEYFIYTDTNYTNLVVLGSGTKLVYTSSSADTERFKLNEEDIVEKIIQQGFSAISDNFEWNKTLFAGNNTGNLTITEMQIITLGEGCQLYGTIADDLTNAPQSIENPAYKENGGDAVSLSSQDVWQVYSRLGLVCGPDYP